MTETITIEAEWDEGRLRCVEIKAEGRSVPYMGAMGTNIHRIADQLTRVIGDWQNDEKRRNISPQ
jgi:hypothetical protein